MCVLTDGGHVADGEGVLGEAEQQAGLADARVADDDELEQVVVAAGLGRRSVCVRGVAPELSHLALIELVEIIIYILKIIES